jgi:hypothetical protein
VRGLFYFKMLTAASGDTVLNRHATTRDLQSSYPDVGWAKVLSCPRGLQNRMVWWATLRFCPPYRRTLVVV